EEVAHEPDAEDAGRARPRVRGVEQAGAAEDVGVLHQRQVALGRLVLGRLLRGRGLRLIAAAGRRLLAVERRVAGRAAGVELATGRRLLAGRRAERVLLRAGRAAERVLLRAGRSSGRSAGRSSGRSAGRRAGELLRTRRRLLRARGLLRRAERIGLR